MCGTLETQRFFRKQFVLFRSSRTTILFAERMRVCRWKWILPDHPMKVGCIFPILRMQFAASRSIVSCARSKHLSNLLSFLLLENLRQGSRLLLTKYSNFLLGILLSSFALHLPASASCGRTLTGSCWDTSLHSSGKTILWLSRTSAELAKDFFMGHPFYLDEHTADIGALNAIISLNSDAPVMLLLNRERDVRKVEEVDCQLYDADQNSLGELIPSDWQNGNRNCEHVKHTIGMGVEFTLATEMAAAKVSGRVYFSAVIDEIKSRSRNSYGGYELASYKASYAEEQAMANLRQAIGQLELTNMAVLSTAAIAAMSEVQPQTEDWRKFVSIARLSGFSPMVVAPETFFPEFPGESGTFVDTDTLATAAVVLNTANMPSLAGAMDVEPGNYVVWLRNDVNVSEPFDSESVFLWGYKTYRSVAPEELMNSYRSRDLAFVPFDGEIHIFDADPRNALIEDEISSRLSLYDHFIEYMAYFDIPAAILLAGPESSF